MVRFVASASSAQPDAGKYRNDTANIGVIRRIVEERMFSFTLDGLDRVVRRLTR